MFRLLILLALHSSSKVDGAPGVLSVDSGMNLADYSVQPSLILDEGKLGINDDVAVEEETEPLSEAEGGLQTSENEPTLQPRGPKDTRCKIRIKTRSAKPTSPPKAPEASDSSSSDSTWDETGRKTVSLERLTSMTEREIAARREKKQVAEYMLSNIRESLSYSDPMQDEYLALLIQTAVNDYNEATQHEWTDVESILLSDRTCGMFILMEELKRIFHEQDTARNGSSGQRESPPDAGKGKKIASPAPAPKKGPSAPKKRRSNATSSSTSV